VRDGYTGARPDIPRAVLDEVDRAIVPVYSAWNGWQPAHVRVVDLEDIHWAQPSGARLPLLHGSVRCDRLHSGRLPHCCEETTAPHRLLVCLLKSHTQAAVFAELSKRAGERVRGSYPDPV
jgi:hypothetical protein